MTWDKIPPGGEVGEKKTLPGHILSKCQWLAQQLGCAGRFSEGLFSSVGSLRVVCIVSGPGLMKNEVEAHCGCSSEQGSFGRVRRAGPAGDSPREGNSHTASRRQRLHLHLAGRFNHLLPPNIAGSQAVVSEIIKHSTSCRQGTRGLTDRSLSLLRAPSWGAL